MLDFKDWMSGIAGALVFLLGLLPLLNKIGKGASWFGFELPITVMAWILLLGGLYLLIDAFVEILNSNIIGWITLVVAIASVGIGLLAVLGNATKISGFFAMGWVNATLYSIFFLILGFFLMIATVARKV